MCSCVKRKISIQMRSRNALNKKPLTKRFIIYAYQKEESPYYSQKCLEDCSDHDPQFLNQNLRYAIDFVA